MVAPRIIASMPGNRDPHWANVVLLCDFNGADGSTTMVDLSNSAHTLAAQGNAQLDTAHFKHGTASLLLDGSGDGVSADDHADWDIGSNDITIETDVRFAANPPTTGYMLCGQWDNSNTGWNIHFINVGGTFYIRLNLFEDPTPNIHAFAFTPNVGVWEHFALVISSGTVHAFQEGVLLASTARLVAPTVSSVAFSLGSSSTGAVSLNGHIDNFRFTNGKARYTANFAPPAREYPTRA